MESVTVATVTTASCLAERMAVATHSALLVAILTIMETSMVTTRAACVMISAVQYYDCQVHATALACRVRKSTILDTVC
jgi:hypothetical protein